VASLAATSLAAMVATSELLAVVTQTMQPTRSSLWLRPSAGATRHQR
jgi:hypothetical protein